MVKLIEDGPAAEEIVTRFKSHQVDDEATINWMYQMRRTLGEVAREIEMRLPHCREKALALTKLEEAMFWINAGASRANGCPIDTPINSIHIDTKI